MTEAEHDAMEHLRIVRRWIDRNVEGLSNGMPHGVRFALVVVCDPARMVEITDAVKEAAIAEGVSPITQVANIPHGPERAELWALALAQTVAQEPQTTKCVDGSWEQ